MILKAKFDTFMENYGVDCYVRRALYNKKCSCRKPTGEPDPNCNMCMGAGYWYEDRKAKVRFSSYSRPEDDRPFSMALKDEFRAYLSTDLDLKPSDQIVEVQLDKSGDLISPPRIVKIHKIKKFTRMYDTDGLSFYTLELEESYGRGTS